MGSNFGPIDTEQHTVINVVNEISQYWDKVSGKLTKKVKYMSHNY